MEELANQYLLQEALRDYGQKEVAGPKSNPWILKMIKAWFPWAKDDSEISWCSIWLNEVAKRSCAEHTNDATARSWLKVGEEIERPMPGDIVVFWRVSRTAWQGHVGIYINQQGDSINVLGGNQANAVNISPYSANRLLGYRRLKVLLQEENTAPARAIW